MVKTVSQNINVFFVTLDREVSSCLICEIHIGPRCLLDSIGIKFESDHFSGFCVGGNIKFGNKIFN